MMDPNGPGIGCRLALSDSLGAIDLMASRDLIKPELRDDRTITLGGG